MEESETLKLIEQFITNGMNITQFNFMVDSDKENFFYMYKSYMEALCPDLNTEIIFDKNKDIMVFIDEKIVCEFVISSDYSSLHVYTSRTIDDEELLNCATMMIMTLKELSMLIGQLASMLGSNMTKKNKISVEKDTEDKNFEKGTNKQAYSTLPRSAYNKINQIESIQKSIMKDIKKYSKRRTDK